jgi:hypothetical protein
MLKRFLHVEILATWQCRGVVKKRYKLTYYLWKSLLRRNGWKRSIHQLTPVFKRVLLLVPLPLSTFAVWLQSDGAHARRYAYWAGSTDDVIMANSDADLHDTDEYNTRTTTRTGPSKMQPTLAISLVI